MFAILSWRYLFILPAIFAGLGLTARLSSANEGISGWKDSPTKVEVHGGDDGTFSFRRNGQLYFIKGAGWQGGSLDLLVECGANSIRTWSADTLGQVVDGKPLIDRCQELGITITVGLWVKHERHGFNYRDPEFIKEQRREILSAVRRYKNHPALLMWGLGNEMDGPTSDGANAPVWTELNELAALIKEEDPNHPVMTAVGGLSPLRLEYLGRYYPNIDILGINVYGQAGLIPRMLRDFGWKKPFVLTEFGPTGHWEAGKTSWNAPIEPSSRRKAESYALNCQLVLKEAEGWCLGTYAFLWGAKQEVTPTWYGMLLPTGEKLPVVDAMTQIWSGKKPSRACPEIASFETKLRESMITPDTEVPAAVKVFGSNAGRFAYEWMVAEESKAQKEGGDFEPPPTLHPACIRQVNGGSVMIRTPSRPGAYRLFVTVRDGNGSAATENVPFFVTPSTSGKVPPGS